MPLELEHCSPITCRQYTRREKTKQLAKGEQRLFKRLGHLISPHPLADSQARITENTRSVARSSCTGGRRTQGEVSFLDMKPEPHRTFVLRFTGNEEKVHILVRSHRGDPIAQNCRDVNSGDRQRHCQATCGPTPCAARNEPMGGRARRTRVLLALV